MIAPYRDAYTPSDSNIRERTWNGSETEVERTYNEGITDSLRM